MMTKKSLHIYDAYYYTQCSEANYTRSQIWLDFFNGVAEQITQRLQPKTVLDAGCAMGFLVEGLRQRNVKAYGIDISEYAIQSAHPDVKPYLWVGSILNPLPQRYDLITCIEVLEHLPVHEAPQAIKNLCSYTDDIIFSSTPFHYKEATHFNVRPPEYWGELFALQGFTRDVDFDCYFITSWAARYRRDRRPQSHILRDYERRFWQLWKEVTDLRTTVVEIRLGQSSGEAERLQALQELQEAKAQLEIVQSQLAESQQKFTQQAETLQHTEHKLAETSSALREVQFQLQLILSSRPWRLVTRWQKIRLKLVPRGSRLETWWRKLLDRLS